MSDSHDNMSFSLKKTEKLKSIKAIDSLFTDGKFLSSGQIILKYKTKAEQDGKICLKMGATVSRKKFKKSVDRNFVKRLLRETYRLKKNEFISLLSQENKAADLMFIYNSNVKPSFAKTQEDMEGILRKLNNRIQAKNKITE